MLKRVGHVFIQRKIGLSVHNGTLEINCPDAARCEWAASKLGVPLKLCYINSRKHQECTVHDGSVTFHFTAAGLREVRIQDCYVKRQRKSPGQARHAYLYFHDKQMAKTMYLPGEETPTSLKAQLWAMAKKAVTEDEGYRLLD